MKKLKYSCKMLAALALICLFSGLSNASEKKVIYIENKSDIDFSQHVNDILMNAGSKSIKLVFKKGIYHFYPKKSFGKFHFVGNHDSGYKNIAFNIAGFAGFEIDGQGSEFIFHGAMLPFLIEKSEGVVFRNFSIDWKVPFFIQGEVIASNSKSGWTDFKMDSNGFSFKQEDGFLKFPFEEGFVYSSLGESLAFDKESKAPVYGSGKYDMHRKGKDVKVEKLPNGNFRFFEKLSHYPPAGSVVVFKGPNGENRYAPAFHCLNSKNVELTNIQVYHSLGMGFIGERSENISLKKFDVKLREGSNRYISASADATHFSNCKGDIVIDSCLFENMLDDGTNVHGTYVKIDSVISNKKIRVQLQHYQQAGIVFGQKGDEVWFLSTPSPQRSNVNAIASYTPINGYYADIVFSGAVPVHIKKGDLIENKTWNTSSFTIKNSIMRNHRARNIVLKDPGKIVIENNYFQSMMAAILIRGESYYWYESGAVTDVLIRDNFFENCVTGGGEQAVLFISPRIDKKFDRTALFDKNIVFENNKIKTFDNMIVWADRTDGLIIRNNEIIQDKSYKPFFPEASLFNFKNCRNVLMEKNSYKGDHKQFIEADERTKQTLINQGDKFHTQK